MKPVCFIICFSVGVSLMVFSGYLPQSAKARSSGANSGTTPETTDIPPARAERAPMAGTVTRKIDTGTLGGVSSRTNADRGPAGNIYAAPPPTVAESPTADSAPAVPAVPAPEHVLPDAPSAGQLDGNPGPSVRPVPTVAASQTKSERAVAADGGPDRVVWIGWDELTLDGSASVGENLTYQWKKLAGPPSLTIKNDSLPITTASGLLTGEKPGWGNVVCKFELTVTDASGAQDKAIIRYVVKSAPALKIRPSAERRIELRDGYQFGHFVSWATNAESYESVFEITSESELTFTKVGGGVYAVTGGKVDKSYIYQVTVYGQTGESTSWVEFLVDTDERIPGIVQLGVSWEGR